MKKLYWLLIIIAILVVGFIVVFRPGSGGEDSWIKDERGVWVKHGYPYETPDYVLQQQSVISSALQLYEQKKSQAIEFSSQCLGVVMDYAVDIVHVPRTAEDNMPENQCQEYRSGEVGNFIELDKEGNIVRIT